MIVYHIVHVCMYVCSPHDPPIRCRCLRSVRCLLSGVLNFSFWKLKWIWFRDKRRRGHAQTDTSDGKLLFQKCQQCGICEGKSRQRWERQAYPCLFLCSGTLCFQHGVFRVGGALSFKTLTLGERERDPPHCHFVVIISSAPFTEGTATSRRMLTQLGWCTLSLLKSLKANSCQPTAATIYLSENYFALPKLSLSNIINGQCA